jgi:pimeloyl-ACP methyl ester carboxylesterase
MQVSANGLAIEVDDQGPPDSPAGPPILMIMGLGMQLTAWPQELVSMLTTRGQRVIRIDNRDAGLSQGFDHLGTPAVAWAAMRYALRLEVHAPYSIADMAADALGVLDALGVAQAHVVGASMGGMIAQHMAATAPQRVARLTLLMTTSGARALPGPSTRVRMALLDRGGAAGDVQSQVNRLARVFTLIGSPAYRARTAAEYETFIARLRASVLRAYRPAGVARQLLAVAADGDRSPMLARIQAPTHIVHGAADPLVPVAAARDLHAKIKGSTLEIIDGMGHDLPAALWSRLADAIAGRGR